MRQSAASLSFPFLDVMPLPDFYGEFLGGVLKNNSHIFPDVFSRVLCYKKMLYGNYYGSMPCGQQVCLKVLNIWNMKQL